MYVIILDEKEALVKISENRDARIQNQICQASKISVKKGWNIIITASKISKDADDEYFGFRFAPNNLYSVGDRITNKDGSVSVVEAVC